MTAQQKTRVTWWAVLGGIAAAASIATAALNGGRGVAKAAAAEVVQPVETRVTRLEERDVARKEQIDRMERKLDAIAGAVGARRE